MYFKQFYLGCLAQASYMIGSEGEAAVVDPRRDVDEYIAEAESQGLEIKYIIETHLHADFVSGHQELAKRTGAQIVFGQEAHAAMPHRAVEDGEGIGLGKVTLRFLETPGHTPESISVLVIDPETSAEPKMALTGDTLFIGDVGRPDLVGAPGHSSQAMAGMLYDSLHRKLLALPDEVEVYPAHGAGSLCGRNMSKETWSTLGEQRQTNYALQDMPKEQFVRMVTVDLPEAPQYFPRDVAINREGASSLEELPTPSALAPVAVEAHLERGEVVLDVREAAAFGTGHVPGSVNIGLGGQFASWAGTLIPADRPLVIVAESEAKVGEAVKRLARVGLEKVIGYLDGGIARWDRASLPLAKVPQMPVSELHEQIAENPSRLQVVDVRRPGEYRGGFVPGAVSFPLDKLEAETGQLDAARPTAVVCASGYRSSTATSLLARKGFRDLYNIVGGTSGWVAAGYETETPREIK